MKKINLASYGFIRSPEDDYIDDSNKFTVFRVGAVEVSKLVKNGRAYISASINSYKLPYKVYSKLPHYKALGKLNGVSVRSLRDEDLIELFDACINYQQEYKDAVNQTKYPTLQELQDKCDELTADLQNQLDKAGQLIKDNILKVFDSDNYYKLKELMSCYMSLKSNIKNSYNRNAYPRSILNTYLSIDLMKTNPAKSWYLRQIEEILK